jgi:hypothetical protein
MDTVTSPEFRRDPRAWAHKWIDALLKPVPKAKLTTQQENYLLGRRASLLTHPERTPGGDLYDKICRIARQVGEMRQRAVRKRLRDIRQAEIAREVHVPPRHAVGAPMPAPPRLRRPIVGRAGDVTETWDPAGSPGL